MPPERRLLGWTPLDAITEADKHPNPRGQRDGYEKRVGTSYTDKLADQENRRRLAGVEIERRKLGGKRG